MNPAHHFFNRDFRPIRKVKREQQKKVHNNSDGFFDNLPSALTSKKRRHNSKFTDTVTGLEFDGASNVRKIVTPVKAPAPVKAQAKKPAFTFTNPFADAPPG